MKVVHGDLLALADSGAFDVIVQGCNCLCTMGSGIARQIRERYPQAYIADLATGADPRGAKLGMFSHADVLNPDETVKFTIVNGYTQIGYGRDGRVYANLDAIADVFSAVSIYWPAARIGYPRIGAGLGGLKWEDVAVVIDRTLVGRDHTLVEWDRSA